MTSGNHAIRKLDEIKTKIQAKLLKFCDALSEVNVKDTENNYGVLLGKK